MKLPPPGAFPPPTATSTCCLYPPALGTLLSKVPVGTLPAHRVPAHGSVYPQNVTGVGADHLLSDPPNSQQQCSGCSGEQADMRADSAPDCQRGPQRQAEAGCPASGAARIQETWPRALRVLVRRSRAQRNAVPSLPAQSAFCSCWCEAFCCKPRFPRAPFRLHSKQNSKDCVSAQQVFINPAIVTLGQEGGWRTGHGLETVGTTLASAACPLP